jgi:hypothetical protein
MVMTLEEQADAILNDHRGDKKIQQADWLSSEQWRLREHREIPAGLIQKGTTPGQYNRTYNPEIGHRPDPNKLFAQGMDPWSQLLWEYYH